jgi:antibiotic biosynthesis monooxygenase (ABM) superfamily enzyme
MPITIKSTTIKPEGVAWFACVSPENLAIMLEYKAWMSSLPGFISSGQESSPDANTRIQVLVFETVEDYAKFVNQRVTNAGWKARKQYVELHQFQIETVETID